MPTNADEQLSLVDTSVAVALCLEDHPLHRSTSSATSGVVLGLAGHAIYETYSVLTRLPAPARRSADAVNRLLRGNFPATRYLSARAQAQLIAELSASGIAGGSVYDALVGAAAREHGARLLTCDRRALGTYQALGVEVELLG